MEGREEGPVYRESHLKSFINSRLDNKRPVIVEGVFVLDALNKIGMNSDIMIRVILTLQDGAEEQMPDIKNNLLRIRHEDYVRRFGDKKPDYIFENKIADLEKFN